MSEKGPKNFPVGEQAGLPARREIKKINHRTASGAVCGASPQFALVGSAFLLIPDVPLDNQTRDLVAHGAHEVPI